MKNKPSKTRATSRKSQTRRSVCHYRIITYLYIQAQLFPMSACEEKGRESRRDQATTEQKSAERNKDRNLPAPGTSLAWRMWKTRGELLGAKTAAPEVVAARCVEADHPEVAGEKSKDLCDSPELESDINAGETVPGRGPSPTKSHCASTSSFSFSSSHF